MSTRSAELARLPQTFSRRVFLLGGGAMVVVAACNGGGGPGADGGVDGGDGGIAESDGGLNQTPAWIAIPDQSWVVGVPVSFDLRDYCTDADGDTLSFTLAGALPAGLSLVGSVITGTPTEVTPTAGFTATADDGRI